MHGGYVDVPFEAVEEAYQMLQKKKNEQVCKILPSVRFGWDQCGYRHPYLVCDRLDGNSTGTSAEFCKNCVLKGRV